MGRWINRDPLGERGGLNLYGFVGNNPVSLIDSDGREISLAAYAAYTFLFGAGATYYATQNDMPDFNLPGIDTKPLSDWLYGEDRSPIDNTTIVDFDRSYYGEGDHSPWSPDPSVNEEFLRDYDRLKDDYDIKPPPYQDPKKPRCNELQNRIDHLQRAIDERENFTDKWYDGVCNPGHAGRIKTLKKDRDKVQRRLDKGNCKKS